MENPNLSQLLIENEQLKQQVSKLNNLLTKNELTVNNLKNYVEKMNIIFDSAPDAIFLIEKDGVFIEVNKIVERVLGYNKKEIIGKNFFELSLLPQAELEKVRLGIEKNIRGEEFELKEVIFRNKEGTVVCAQFATYPAIVNERTVILGIVKDISDRKNAELALLKNEQRLSLHINQTLLGVVEWDLDFNVEKWNPAAEKIFGYTEEEAIGKNVTFIVPDFCLSPVETLLGKLVRTGKGVKSINHNIKKNSDLILCEWYNTPLVNENGEVISVASLVHDISERADAEQIQRVLYNISNAVNTSDNLHKLIGFIQTELGEIIDTTNFYIALYNEKDDTLSLPFFVDEIDKFTSIPAGKTLTKYVVKTKKPILADLQLMKELERRGEIETVGADSKIWLGVPLKTEGKIIGVLAVQSYTDEHAFNSADVQMLEFVSDQIGLSINHKKTEDELIAALKKAEESDKLKTAFLQNMSHEIRTPMNGILGFTSLLKEADNFSDRQREYLRIIEKSGERMLSTINDLMDISKVEAGQMNIELTEVNVNELMSYIQTFFSPEAAQKKLRFSCMKELPNEDIFIVSDREKLYAILINLVKNAIKYTKNGSVDFGYQRRGPEFEFFVKDSGIGISKENLASIFDRFVRVHQNLTSSYEGTGLGLSITKAYIELLGGEIGVESELGVGSTFTFTIPDRKKVSPQYKHEQKQPNKLTGSGLKLQLKILITDDDETIRKYLSIVVRKISKEILFAKNGKESIEICRANRDIDLILMDIKMPGMDGYEATKNIRKFNSDVVIVAQTAFAFESEQNKVVDAGCNDYLAKPIKRDDLIDLVCKYFDP